MRLLVRRHIHGGNPRRRSCQLKTQDQSLQPPVEKTVKCNAFPTPREKRPVYERRLCCRLFHHYVHWRFLFRNNRVDENYQSESSPFSFIDKKLRKFYSPSQYNN